MIEVFLFSYLICNCLITLLYCRSFKHKSSAILSILLATPMMIYIIISAVFEKERK